MVRKALLTFVFTAPLVWASAASADTIQFDPSGTGLHPLAIDTFDPGPGNVITINSGGATLQLPGQQVQTLFQANLKAADNSATFGTEYSNGANYFGTIKGFTFVAGIPETISATSTGLTLNLDISGATPAAPTANNYFYIYAESNTNNIVNGGVPNDLTGVCFTCGTLILQGVIVNDSNFSNSFTVDPVASGQPGVGVPLDAFNVDNYPDVNTLAGTGGLVANIQIISANAGYFPGLISGATVLWSTTTQNNLPYLTVDPSACFSRNGLTAVTACGVPGSYPGAGNPNVGPLNGEGVDVMLQSDSSISFGPTVVPEPATLMLLGLGLAGVAARRRRQAKSKA